jgi:hypothetical protein
MFYIREQVVKHDQSLFLVPPGLPTTVHVCQGKNGRSKARFRDPDVLSKIKKRTPHGMVFLIA